MTKSYKKTKIACYMANVCMSAVIILPPLLFVTFRDLYGISYSLLGLLVVINFTTQLIVDLIFSFFSDKFNIPLTVKSIPALAVVGFLIYGILPLIFPEYAYLGLVIGTIIFSASSGLAEVLISPVIAAIPSDNPDREMSKLHSAYAWGVVGVVIFSTFFLQIVGSEQWYFLLLAIIFLPLICLFLFFNSNIPPMHPHEKERGMLKLLTNKGMLFCIFAIFLGGASENIISQWSSSFLEKSLQLPKIWGDMLGVAFFAVMLGIGRSLYAHKGKNIRKTMFVGAVGASICYFIVILFDFPAISIVACAFTGFFVAMLWPGSLIIVGEKFPKAGVAIFALMAAGGDLGSALGPQIMGIAVDFTVENPTLLEIGANLGYSPEQFGMKVGLLVVSLFPVACALLLSAGLKNKKTT